MHVVEALSAWRRGYLPLSSQGLTLLDRHISEKARCLSLGGSVVGVRHASVVTRSLSRSVPWRRGCESRPLAGMELDMELIDTALGRLLLSSCGVKRVPRLRSGHIHDARTTFRPFQSVFTAHHKLT